MFCSACGSQTPDEARFCAVCGQPVAPAGAPSPAAVSPVPPPPPSTPPVATPPTFPPVPPAPTGYTGYGPQVVAGYGVPPKGPDNNNRKGLWIGIAVAAVIIIGAAVAVPLLLRDGHDTTTTSTVAHTTTSTTSSSTTETSTTTTSEATTTTTVAAGAPGDSAGEWVELDAPKVDGEAWAACVSDQALLIKGMANNQPTLHAYMMDSGDLIQLPIEASEFYGEDLDGLLAVWWEGDYDEETYEYYNEHVYSYLLPNGPKIEVAAGSSMTDPQVAGSWITWAEREPWEENPEEYSLLRVLGVQVDSSGVPVGEPTVLVSSATAYTLGDSFWTYSLSGTHLAWENATAVDIYDAGTYVMDLEALQPLAVGGEAWRPSVSGDTLVYYQDGLKAMDLTTRGTREIDLRGDFATAAPTFAAYFRAIESPDDYSYEIVARGYGGDYEQVLGKQSEPPWLSPFTAASDTHVAFAADGVLHLFEWQGR
jgi:hypothetical protein